MPRASLRISSSAPHLLLVAALGLPAASAFAQQRPPDMLHIDHVIVGTSSLAHGMAELATLTGVNPQFGGRHPGRGTQNALLSLGNATYLELAAPSGEPDSSGTAAYLASLAHLTPAGWALATSDLAATITRLRAAGLAVSGPFPGARQQADGTLLRWATARLDTDSSGLAPFLIQWDSNSRHPATTAPGGCTLVSLELFTPALQSLRQVLALLGTTAIVAERAEAGIRITLACPTGGVVLGD
jgi:hypothetical protein